MFYSVFFIYILSFLFKRNALTIICNYCKQHLVFECLCQNKITHQALTSATRSVLIRFSIILNWFIYIFNLFSLTSTTFVFVSQVLICLIDKKTGEKTQVRPRYIKQDQVGVARLEVNAGMICLETFKDFPQMGRFTLRDEGIEAMENLISTLLYVDFLYKWWLDEYTDYIFDNFNPDHIEPTVIQSFS